MSKGQDILIFASQYIGQPYVWGGESIQEGGYDCSGYVYNVLRDAQVNVPRDTAQGYYNRFKGNKADKNTKGALLFFGKNPSKITHVAISRGDGTMYESIGGKQNNKKNPGRGVTISPITRRKDLVCARLPFKAEPETTTRPYIKPCKRGDMGIDVRMLQDVLCEYGYGFATPGIYDDTTFRAVADFQSKHKLPITGEADSRTIAKL